MTTGEEEQPEILELPESADSAQTATDGEGKYNSVLFLWCVYISLSLSLLSEPPLTDSATELPSEASEEKHQEL